MISRSTNIRAALRSRQRGFLLNPYRFGSAAASEMLLLRGDGSDGSTPVDSSSFARSLTGAAKVSTTESKYGGSSIKFDASFSYLDFGDSDDFWPSSNQFTIRAWVWISSSASGGSLSLLSQAQSSASASSFVVWCNVSGGFGFYCYSGASQSVSLTGGAVSTNAWHHVEATRDGNVYRLYVDGTQVGSTGSIPAALNNSSEPLRVGKQTFYGQFTGYIDDLQYLNGTCLHTGGTAFTPPGAL